MVKILDINIMINCVSVCVCRGQTGIAGQCGRKSERTWKTLYKDKDSRCYRINSGWRKRNDNWWAHTRTHIVFTLKQASEKVRTSQNVLTFQIYKYKYTHSSLWP